MKAVLCSVNAIGSCAALEVPQTMLKQAVQPLGTPYFWSRANFQIPFRKCSSSKDHPANAEQIGCGYHPHLLRRTIDILLWKHLACQALLPWVEGLAHNNYIFTHGSLKLLAFCTCIYVARLSARHCVCLSRLQSLAAYCHHSNCTVSRASPYPPRYSFSRRRGRERTV